jgi:hypothetical protein
MTSCLYLADQLKAGIYANPTGESGGSRCAAQSGGEFRQILHRIHGALPQQSGAGSGSFIKQVLGAERLTAHHQSLGLWPAT